MMELFGLLENRYNSVSGVSMVPGTFNTFPCFHLHSDAFLAQPTKYAHIFTFLNAMFHTVIANSCLNVTDIIVCCSG